MSKSSPEALNEKNSDNKRRKVSVSSAFTIPSAKEVLDVAKKVGVSFKDSLQRAKDVIDKEHAAIAKTNYDRKKGKQPQQGMDATTSRFRKS